MSGRYLRSIAILALICLFAGVCSACRHGEGEPEPLSIRGEKIVVWDAVEPSFPDSPSYQASVTAIVEAFEQERGVEVDLHFVSRHEIDQYLADGKVESGEAPCLIHSTEWPTLHEKYRDVALEADPDGFLDAATHYWSRDGRLYGIPAYIHWFGTAVESSLVPGELADVVADGTWAAEIAGETGYWHDSQAFLPSALDWDEAGWSPENTVAYLKWVKERYGDPLEDPLAAWQDGVVSALSPVTPHLFRWLNSTGGAKMRFLPVPRPEDWRANGEITGLECALSQFFYTVPGYGVLGESPAQQRCAALLGQLLAENLGRWAARVLGCVPARVQDTSFYHLESGWSYSERMAFLEQLEACSLVAPTQEESLMRMKVSQVCRDSLSGFFRGDVSEQELMSKIRDILTSD